MQRQRGELVPVAEVPKRGNKPIYCCCPRRSSPKRRCLVSAYSANSFTRRARRCSRSSNGGAEIESGTQTASIEARRDNSREIREFRVGGRARDDY